jgi:small conductance mechanosensitive channel
MESFLALPYVKYSLITVIALLVAFVISKILRILIDRFIKLSSKKLKVDHTQFNFLKNAVTLIVFMIAIIFIFYSIPKLKAEFL